MASKRLKASLDRQITRSAATLSDEKKQRTGFFEGIGFWDYAFSLSVPVMLAFISIVGAGAQGNSSEAWTNSGMSLALFALSILLARWSVVHFRRPVIRHMLQVQISLIASVVTLAVMVALHPQ